MFSAVIAFAVAVVLARALGPHDYGIYSYVFAIISILAVPAQIGLPTLVVRETARAEARGEWGLMRGLWRWSNSIVGWTSAALILLAIGGLEVFGQSDSRVEWATFLWGVVLVPLIALGSLRGAALRGLRKVIQGQLPEYVLRPALFVLLVSGWLVLDRRPLSPDLAMLLHVIAATLAFAIGVWLLWREKPLELKASVTPEYKNSQWLASTLPLALIAGMQVVITQIDTVVLGFFANASDIGMYRVAIQGSQAASFGMVALGFVTMPYFARLHATGDLVRLQRVAATSALVSTILAVPIALPLVLFPRPILHLIFGAKYLLAATPLVILTAAQLINAAFGTIGPLLIMAGYERDAARVMAYAAGGNLLLSVALIPMLGVNGAALASGVTIIAWNALLWWTVWKRLAIDTSVIAWFRPLRSVP